MYVSYLTGLKKTRPFFYQGRSTHNPGKKVTLVQNSFCMKIPSCGFCAIGSGVKKQIPAQTRSAVNLDLKEAHRDPKTHEINPIV
jgi:hypothetical protein